MSLLCCKAGIRRVQLGRGQKLHAVLAQQWQPGSLSAAFHCSRGSAFLDPYKHSRIGWEVSSTSFYHSTTPTLKKPRLDKEKSYDQQIIALMKKDKVDFQKMEELLEFIYTKTDYQLNIMTFVSIVKRCIRMENYEAAEAAERIIFGHMMEFYKKGRPDEAPNANTFVMVMQAWVKSRHPSSGKRAENLLNYLEDWGKQGILPFAIDAPIYNTAMKAYAIHGDVDSTQAIFDRCNQAFENGTKSARPTVFTWSTLLDAHAKSNSPDNWKKAENAFQEMQIGGILANTITYNSLINACAKSKQPQRAEHWLEEMYKDYQGGNESAKPDLRSFSTVLNAWAKSDTTGGAERSENILNCMIELANEGILPVRPHTVSYNTVIDAYAVQGEPREAERILQLQYDDFQAGNKRATPDIRGLNSIIHAWAQAKEEISGERAELILNRIVELKKEGILQQGPNAHTYNCVISTWAVLGQPVRARQVFDRMLQKYKKGTKNAKPDGATFRSLMQAYSNAQVPIVDAAEVADELLAKMEELHLQLGPWTLASAVRCWEDEGVEHSD